MDRTREFKNPSLDTQAQPTGVRVPGESVRIAFEELVDMRQMIVNTMENDRRLMVNMFLRVGQKEINFIWHISALIGLVFGLIQMFIFLFVPQHWTVPFFAAIWGLLTNWIAIWMVFNPVEPRFIPYVKFFRRSSRFPFVVPQLPHIAQFRFQGGFMKRQEEVSEDAGSGRTPD